MADWTDGPEYAPHARPDAFVAAGAPALSAPEQPGRPEPAPAERPDFAGTGDGVPLDQLAAQAPDARDPHAAAGTFRQLAARLESRGLPARHLIPVRHPGRNA